MKMELEGYFPFQITLKKEISKLKNIMFFSKGVGGILSSQIDGELAKRFSFSLEDFQACISDKPSEKLVRTVDFIGDVSFLTTLTPSELVEELFFFSGSVKRPESPSFSKAQMEHFQTNLRHTIEEFRCIEVLSRQDCHGDHLTDEELSSRIGWSLENFKGLVAQEPYPPLVDAMGFICSFSFGLGISPSDLVNRLFNWNRSKVYW